MPTLKNNADVKLYSIGCVQKVSKFQNPEINANAFYLYVFFFYFIIGNLVLLSQIYEMRFNNQSDGEEECVEYR